MKQRFDLSFGAFYLAFVSIGYVVVGALGAFADFPLLPYMMAVFLMVDPYPLLHMLGRCTLYFPWSMFDVPYEFGGFNEPRTRFIPMSLILLCLGLCGVFAVFARNRAGRYALLVLTGLSTAAAIWNWIDFAIAIRQYGPYIKGAYGGPTISVVWSLSYWLAFSRLKLHEPQEESYW